MNSIIRPKFSPEVSEVSTTPVPFGVTTHRGKRPPVLVELGLEYMEKVVELEQRSYPSPWSPALVRGEFEKDISLRMGFVQNDEVLAYSFSYLIPEDLHLLNLAVSPEHRGLGLGKRLLCSLLLRALASNVRYVNLEVRPSNRAARSLYKTIGFRSVGIRREYYRDNGEDALLLERVISEKDRGFFEQFSKDS